MNLKLTLFLLFLCLEQVLCVPVTGLPLNNLNPTNSTRSDSITGEKDEFFYASANIQLLKSTCEKIANLMDDLHFEVGASSIIRNIKYELDKKESITHSILYFFLNTQKVTTSLLQLTRSLDEVDEDIRAKLAIAYTCWNNFYDKETSKLMHQITDTCFKKLNESDELAFTDGLDIVLCVKSLIPYERMVNVTKNCLLVNETTNTTTTATNKVVTFENLGVEDLVQKFIEKFENTKNSAVKPVHPQPAGRPVANFYGTQSHDWDEEEEEEGNGGKDDPNSKSTTTTGAKSDPNLKSIATTGAKSDPNSKSITAPITTVVKSDPNSKKKEEKKGKQFSLIDNIKGRLQKKSSDPPKSSGTEVGKSKSEKENTNQQKQHKNKPPTIKESSANMYLRTVLTGLGGGANVLYRIIGFIILFSCALVFVIGFAYGHWGITPQGLTIINDLQTTTHIISYWTEAAEAVMLSILVLAILILHFKKSVIDPLRFMCSYRSSASYLDHFDRVNKYVAQHTYDQFITSLTKGPQGYTSVVHFIEDNNELHLAKSDPITNIIGDNEFNLVTTNFGHIKIASYEQWAKNEGPKRWFSPTQSHNFDFLRYITGSYPICKKDVFDPILVKHLARHAPNFVREPHSDSAVEAITKKIYQFRRLQLFSAVIQKKIVMANNDQSFQTISKSRKEIETEINKLIGEFQEDLHPFWIKMEYVLENVEKNHEISETIEVLEFLVEKLLFIILGLHMILEFLDLEGECQPLVKEDRTPIGMPGDKVFLKRVGYHGSPTWDLNPLFNARAWECDHFLGAHHGEIGNSERSTICILKCEPGFDAVEALTYCDSLGGGGMIWSHLNAGIKGHGKGNIFEPACCIASSNAPHLKITSTSIKKTTGAVEFHWPTGFSRACQAHGHLGMIVQICSGTTVESCEEEGDDVAESHLEGLTEDPEHALLVQLQSSGSAVTTTTTTTTTTDAQASKGNIISKFVEITFDSSTKDMANYQANTKSSGTTATYATTFVPRFLRMSSYSRSGLVHGNWYKF